ncbi:homeodomain-like protein [Tanacetum coccineum]
MDHNSRKLTLKLHISMNPYPKRKKDPGRLGELAHTKLTVELADRTVKYPKGIIENILVGIGKFTFPIDFIILDMPEDIRVPLIPGRPFLSTARAKIDVYKRKITLRVGEENIIFKSVKPASCIIKRIWMLSLRERMDLDLEARLMGETLVLNRSLDPFKKDYFELNDLNEPFKLRRNQGDDLITIIKEGKVIEEFIIRNEDLYTRIDDYPKKIHIDCAHNLKFSCMIGFEFTHANFFPLLYVNMMSRKFHNSIMKNKMVYKGNNVVGALMNVPIFVGTFSVMTDFAVLENMDAYRDERMGDVIFGEPFLREVDIKAKRFEGMITLYKGDDEVTYQMVRSHPRFKHHTNEQCNKIPSLLKVNEKDVMNGVSHAYQKLKGFYKGDLNLGPDYIRNAKTEEWLTRGHISVHEQNKTLGASSRALEGPFWRKVHLLVEAGIMREVLLPDWLLHPSYGSNRSDVRGGLAVCAWTSSDLRTNACSTRMLSTTHIRLESGTSLLRVPPSNVFLDAYKGYHQSNGQRLDEEKDSLSHKSSVYCIKMPFGLRMWCHHTSDLVDNALLQRGQVGRKPGSLLALRLINMKLNPKEVLFWGYSKACSSDSYSSQQDKSLPLIIQNTQDVCGEEGRLPLDYGSRRSFHAAQAAYSSTSHASRTPTRGGVDYVTYAGRMGAISAVLTT